MVRRLISGCMALLMLGCALAEDELDITLIASAAARSRKLR